MNKKNTILISLLVIVVDLFFHFYLIIPTSEINPYFTRDVERALAILQGYWVFVGPDFSSGTYAPGPFWNLLLVPIVVFTQKTSAILAYFSVLTIAMQSLFSYFFSKRFQAPFFVLYLLISSSSFLLERLSWPNNSSFIYPLVLLGTLSLYRFYEERRNLTLGAALASLVLVLSIQIHFSTVVLWPFFFLILFTKKSSVRDKFFGGLLFVLILFIASLPYFYAWKFMTGGNKPFFALSDLGFDYFCQPVSYLMTKLEQFKFPSFLKRPETLLVFIYVLGRSIRNLINKSVGPFERRITAILVFLVLLSFPWLYVRRYYVVFHSLFVLLFLFDFVVFFQRNKLSLKYLILFVALLVIPLRYEMIKHAVYILKTHDCRNCLAQLDVLCKYMNKNHVSFDEFQSKTYQIYVSENEGGLYTAKDCLNSSTANTPNNKLYLYVNKRVYKEIPQLSEVLRQIPKELQEVYAQEKLQPVIDRPGFAFYQVQKPESFHFKRLTNLTYIYDLDPGLGENFLLKKLSLNQSYYARLCDTKFFCDVFITLDKINNYYEFTLNSRIFQTIYNLDPYYAQAKGISLEGTCDNKKVIFFTISSLGSTSLAMQNQTFFTPLVWQAPYTCQSITLDQMTIDELNLSTPQKNLSHYRKLTFPIQLIKYFSKN